MIDIDTLIKKIQNFLCEKDISTSRMEREADIPHGTLRTLLNKNSKKPSVFLMMKIAKYMGESLDNLLDFQSVYSHQKDPEVVLTQAIVGYVFAKSNSAIKIKWDISADVFEFCATKNNMIFDKKFADYTIEKAEVN